MTSQACLSRPLPGRRLPGVRRHGLRAGVDGASGPAER